MVVVRLNGVMHAGTLPPSWRALSKLQVLDVSRNKLIGPLPDSWSALGLSSLNLSRNALLGTVPASWGNLRLARYIRLDHNILLSGCLPRAWHRPFSGSMGSVLSAGVNSSSALQQDTWAKVTNILGDMDAVFARAIGSQHSYNGTGITGYC